MTFDAPRAAELHQSLISGDDPTASLQITEMVLDQLLIRLRAKWPTTDRADVDEAGMESLARYLDAPQRFDPKKSSLLTWLTMDAHGDLINAYRARQKRPQELPHANVADAAGIRKEDLLAEFDPTENDSEVFTVVAEALPSLTDRRLVLLMVEGDRSVTAAAEVMGISQLPKSEREREVKKAKDRIKKLLRRRLRP